MSHIANVCSVQLTVDVFQPTFAMGVHGLGERCQRHPTVVRWSSRFNTGIYCELTYSVGDRIRVPGEKCARCFRGDGAGATDRLEFPQKACRHAEHRANGRTRIGPSTIRNSSRLQRSRCFAFESFPCGVSFDSDSIQVLKIHAMDLVTIHLQVKMHHKGTEEVANMQLLSCLS